MFTWCPRCHRHKRPDVGARCGVGARLCTCAHPGVHTNPCIGAGPALFAHSATVCECPPKDPSELRRVNELRSETDSVLRRVDELHSETHRERQRVDKLHSETHSELRRVDKLHSETHKEMRNTCCASMSCLVELHLVDC
uniref:Uncharacterized protein n=1 Tax=Chlamydomonas euryale TaxID=1486919 RepID=A0A7R9V5K2_9CHLO|mmetsp:Transcript_17319/g.52077  ORF Transcript_17319/g.52077 Transcript_17319/m.52077 type:complete len:140 (+) Transcript_17319:372-791(+)